MVTALLLTVCVGFLLNVDERTETRTTYDELADLDAIMYANSDRTQSAIEYNSVYNITGWTPSSIIPTTSQPNAYVITPSDTQYSGAQTYNTTWERLGIVTSSDGGYLFKSSLTAVNASYQYAFKSTIDGYYLNGAKDSSGHGLLSDSSGSTRLYHGGAAESYVYNTDNFGSTATTSISLPTTDAYVVWVSLAELLGWAEVTPSDGMRVSLSFAFPDSTDYKAATVYSAWPTLTATGNYQYTSAGLNVYTYDYTVQRPTQSLFSYVDGLWSDQTLTETWTYSSSTEKWTSSVGVITSAADPLYYFRVSDLTDATITVSSQQRVQVQATYADPVQPVTISKRAEWSVSAYNDSLQTTAATFLWVPQSTTDTNICTLKIGVKLNDTWQGGYSLNAAYGVLGFGITSSNKIVLGSYPAALVTVDCLNGTIVMEGVLSWTDGRTYARSGVTISDALTLNNGVPSGPFQTLAFTPNGTTQKIYIESTTVLSDPNSVMWQDANVNLSNYFSVEDLRVTFNGFVAYGSSITINGKAYTVTAGRISIDVGTGRQTIGLSGMSIDYLDDKTYLRSGSRTVELGDTSDRTIIMSGTWYCSAIAYEIKQTATTGYAWTWDWSLDENAAFLIYAAIVLVGAGIGYGMLRDSFGVYDWAIIAIGLITAFTLMQV